MIWPFKRSRLLNEETEDWHLENFEWLVRSYGEYQSLTKAKLVLPRPGFFQTDGEKGHALAERMFEQVKQYCQVEDWPMHLETGTPLPEQGRSLFEVQHGRTALGLHQAHESNATTITYAANLVDHPEQLIATLAHEIGHEIILRAPREIVCAEDEIEFLTDLAAIYMGFGVFLANTALQFEQWRDDAIGTQGWRMNRQGYLPEPDLVFGLAIFLALKELDPSDARACLKPHLAKMLDMALRDLSDREEDIVRIRSIEQLQG